MLNRGKICELNKLVNACKSNIDNMIEKYHKELAEVEQKKDRYSTDYFEALKKEVCVRYKKLIDLEKEIALHKTAPILEEIEANVKEWLQESPNMDFINRMEVMKTTGIEVGKAEAEMLQKSAKGNYLSERAFYKYATSQGNNMEFISLKLKEPTAEKILDQVKTIKSDVDVAIKYYCGAGKQLEVNFIDEQNVVSYALMSKASKDITKNINPISQEWGELMLKDGEPLTEGEKAWLEEKIGYSKGLCAKEKAESLVQQYPNSKELVALSDEYKGLIEQ